MKKKNKLRKNPAFGVEMAGAIEDMATSAAVSMALAGTTPREKLLISSIIPSLLTIIRTHGKDWETMPVEVIWDKIDPLDGGEQNHE